MGKLIHLGTEILKRSSPYTVAVWWPSYRDYGRKHDYMTEDAAKGRCIELAKEGYDAEKSQIHLFITKDGKTERYQYKPDGSL